MPVIDVLWDLPDDPDGNIQHVAQHGLTPLDVEHALNHPVRRGTSRSTGRPIAFGHTPSGELIAIVYEEIEDGVITRSRLIPSRNNAMARKAYRNISRGRRLTKEEAAKFRALRQRVEQELPPSQADPLKVAIAKLRAMREAKGISLSDLAARTGMTRGNIARLESQKNATLRTLERYARGLDCALEIDVVSVGVKKPAKRHAVR